ncbi:hypothetical protein ACFE04_007921 [Oxalis oulophora]
MASTKKQVLKELPTLIKLYTDGSVERLLRSRTVPPSLDPETGVSSKDTIISEDPPVSARLYHPKLATQSSEKFPILVYFHGGGFCLESAFSFFQQRYMNKIASQARILIVSVEYRLAPENPLPAAYDDSWCALQWVGAHSVDNNSNGCKSRDCWLLDYADVNRLYIGGDSSGANIAHNIAMRAGYEGLNHGVKISGCFLSHPFFWGSVAIGREGREDREKELAQMTWDFVYPSAENGIDNFMINPAGPGAKSLSLLGSEKLLICVSEEDGFRDRGIWYYDLVKKSGWGGEIDLFEVKGEDHLFHIFYPETWNAERLFTRLAEFLH